MPLYWEQTRKLTREPATTQFTPDKLAKTCFDAKRSLTMTLLRNSTPG